LYSPEKTGIRERGSSWVWFVARYLLENSQVRGDRLQIRIEDMEANSHTLQPHPPTTSSNVCQGKDKEEGVAVRGSGVGMAARGSGEVHQESSSGGTSSGTDSGAGTGGVTKEEKSTAEEVGEVEVIKLRS